MDGDRGVSQDRPSPNSGTRLRAGYLARIQARNLAGAL
jgi:hypothetical protein